jgi:hypothetical protein
MRRKIRRLSGPAVAIGYILLIPSILGMAACAILLIVSLLAGVAGAAHGSAFATAFAGIGAIAFVYIGILSFVFGLVGWLLIMKKHILQCVYCGAVVDAAAAVYSHPNRSFRRARVFGIFLLFLILIAMAVGLFHNDYRTWASGGRSLFDWTEFEKRWQIHTTTGPAQPTPDNTLQTPQATDNEATQTLEEAEKDKQLKLGTDAMVTAWQWTPVAFNERENLRFDAVIVMPDDTVCLSIHDAHPFPGVEEPNALISLQDKGVPPGRRLYPVNNVSFDLWTRECVNQPGGIDVEPEILERFNLIKQHMEELNQRLHNSQQ